MCGRLRCCLIYEYEQYVEARRHLPKLKSIVGTPLGPGKVVEILHLRDSVRVKIGEGPEAREVEFHREQLTPLEALQRLQEKALSGTCDRHENGECDCGKGKPVTAQQAAPQAEAQPAAAATGQAKKRRRRRAKKTPTDLARPAQKDKRKQATPKRKADSQQGE